MNSTEQTGQGSAVASPAGDAVTPPNGPMVVRQGRRPSNNRDRRWTLPAGLIAAVAVVVLVPIGGTSDATLFQLTTIVLWMCMGLAWNWVAGFAGRLDLAFGAYYAVGAYLTAYLVSTHAWNPGLAVVCSTVAGGLVALLLGPAFLKIKGIAFAIATLSVYTAAEQMAPLLSIIGGGAGLTVPLVLGRRGFWYLFGALAIAAAVATVLIRRSQFGLALLARREDELSADSRGINIVATQVSIYTVMGAMMGLVGSLWALQTGFVSPETVFTPSLLSFVLIIVLLGGIGTVVGPVIGAIVFIEAGDYLWNRFLDYHDFILALLLIAVALLAPDGLTPSTARDIRSRVRRATRAIAVRIRPGGRP